MAEKRTDADWLREWRLGYKKPATGESYTYLATTREDDKRLELIEVTLRAMASEKKEKVIGYRLSIGSRQDTAENKPDVKPAIAWDTDPRRFSDEQIAMIALRHNEDNELLRLVVAYRTLREATAPT